MSRRYAIYYCPARDTHLWRQGSAWLGYDAATGRKPPPPDSLELPRHTFETAVTAPARYGFHATLVAPFELADQHSESALCAALTTFCDARHPFAAPLEVQRLDRFLALTPMATDQEACRKLNELAESCVRTFDAFRAPLSEHDRRRRATADLAPRQRAHLARWGYPYVLDAFRFHMSLTGALPTDMLAPMQAVLGRLFDDVLRTPAPIAGLTLVTQPERDSPFTWVRQFPFCYRKKD